MRAGTALLAAAIVLVAAAPHAQAATVEVRAALPETVAVGTPKDILVPVAVACPTAEVWLEPSVRLAVHPHALLEGSADPVALEAGPCPPGWETVVQVPVRIWTRDDAPGDRLAALRLAATFRPGPGPGTVTGTGTLQVELEFHPALDIAVDPPTTGDKGEVRWQLEVTNRGDSPVRVDFRRLDVDGASGTAVLPPPLDLEPRETRPVEVSHRPSEAAEPLRLHAYPYSKRDGAVAGEPVLVALEPPADAARPVRDLPAPSVAAALAALAAAAVAGRRR